ncbi:MAG: glycosyltransferase family 4 protein [Chloroflexota bacterium]
MRLCIIYDCLYPWTIGGAERWYRLLAEHLAAEGHDVVYLTRDQWSPGPPPAISGVRVVPVSGPDSLYASGRRAIAPPARFGIGVHRHLARHGASYDAVACASFPYFSTLAAGRLRDRFGYRLVVDWWEVWSDAYWRHYLGPARGRAGAMIQRRCAAMPHVARCAAPRHAERLRRLGFNGPVLPIGGIHQQGTVPAPAQPRPAGGYLIVTGRLTPDKGSGAVLPALAEARRVRPDLRAVIAGDGPSAPMMREQARRLGLERAVDFRGFVSETELDGLIAGATCLLNPSRREGYGLSILDAACRGVPSVVAPGPDNAAADLIETGANGEIAGSPAAADLASAILRVDAAGEPLRRSTFRWWAATRPPLDAGDGLQRAGEALFGPLPQ